MIQVHNLTKYYNDFCAVDSISLDINKGEILGLLGPNGAGKTTTLRMLTGFFKPSSGDIIVNDFSILTDSLKIKKLMGYLPESAPLYHNMLVFDYLDYVAKIRGLDKEKRPERLKELSDMCGLARIMHKPVHELSKGLKQRVGLAHAMMTDPEILILDEPTSGLDPNQIADIRAIIKRIGKEKTIIFSTHILSEAEATCDRIIIINKGKIVADDSTQSLKEKARQGSCIRLSLSGADPEKAEMLLKEITGDDLHGDDLHGDDLHGDDLHGDDLHGDDLINIEKTESTEQGSVSFEIKTRNNMDLRKEIYLKIKETDWIITEFFTESKTLEKIFRELTKEN